MNKVSAIVYTSNAGHTKQFAQLLAEKTGLEVFELKESKSKLKKGSAVLFMGWLMAGTVKGYKKARKFFDVKALCGVGMAPYGKQIKDIKEKNSVSEDMAVFSLQGGFELNKLHGVYKFMMSTMKNVLGKKMAKKTDLTIEEKSMLDLLMNGKDLVKEEELSEIVQWING